MPHKIFINLFNFCFKHLLSPLLQIIIIIYYINVLSVLYKNKHKQNKNKANTGLEELKEQS